MEYNGSAAPTSQTPLENSAILERITLRVENIKKLLLKNQTHINPGALKMFRNFLRLQMDKIYGTDSEISQNLPALREEITPEVAFEKASALVDRAETFIRNVREVGIASFRERKQGKIFIGHGRSPLWRELKDFLFERLNLNWVEFNSEAVAGFTTFERISEMLAEAEFAFLIMTGDDLHADDTVHARENVVHEVGLFQGKLGPKRAIVLLEDGCNEFSNIVGLSRIRFPKGNISAKFEDIRKVLERENVL
jgi:predicted nucleotide-binding protein